MEKFLEFLRVEGCGYTIKNESVIVLELLAPISVRFDNIAIPENTDFAGGLGLADYDDEIQLPENLKVAVILDLTCTNTKRLPSNLTIYDDCSVLLDACQFENVSYRDNCGRWKRTIFAFWANDDFLIAAGCFAGTYSEFEERVNDAYYDDKDAATEYKRQAQNCISELAEKLGKPDPFKNQ